jgi:hypothetical protein
MSRGKQLYATVRDYKNPQSGVQAQAEVRVAGLLGRFLRDHESCLVDRAGAWDVITHVPSGSGRHAEPHPLVRAMKRYEPLAVQHATLLVPGSGDVGRNQGSDALYSATPSAEGRHVLLVDDTWTTGAHAQSAASALTLAGATVVAVLTIGRMVSPSPDYDGPWWDTQSREPFDFNDCCIHP